MSMSNPLLSDWTGAFGLAPFAEISDADFDRLFNKLDLPALVGPTIAILKPSRIISPTF